MRNQQNQNNEITKEKVQRALLVLIDNGIDEEEAQPVLQAIGYALLDMELEPFFPNDEIRSAQFISRWDDGSMFKTSCTVNVKTRRIIALSVGFAGCSSPAASLEAQVVVLNDREYPVYEDENEADDNEEYFLLEI